MNSKSLILKTLFLLCVGQINATVWHVGASQTYSAPSLVAALVNNGDTVDIDAGVYNSNVCTWTKNNLLLRCTNGMAHLKSNGLSQSDKGIWVIQGNNTTVEHIEFSLCKNSSETGAGIRQDGQNLIVKNCYFHENEMGILTGGVLNGRIKIEFSEFNNNGTGNSMSHNVYIGAVDSLIFKYNYVHHNNAGCELKSRARVNYILYNRISNEATGTAGNEVDLPNGGLAIIMGNIIHQGVNTNNPGIVFYGTENLSNAAPHNLYVVNNTIVNERSSGIFVKINNATSLYKSYNNIFAGVGSSLNGAAVSVDTVSNIRANLAALNFVNASLYDYRLLPNSLAIGTATNAGVASSGFPLQPLSEYIHPCGLQSRTATQDAGAYEHGVFISIPENRALKNILVVYENEQLEIKATHELTTIILLSSDGSTVYKNFTPSRVTTISTSNFAKGIYILCVIEEGIYQYKKLVID